MWERSEKSVTESVAKLNESVAKPNKSAEKLKPPKPPKPPKLPKPKLQRKPETRKPSGEYTGA